MGRHPKIKGNKPNYVKRNNKRFSKLQKRGKAKKVSTLKLNMGATAVLPKHLHKRFGVKRTLDDEMYAQKQDTDEEVDEADPIEMMDEDDLEFLEKHSLRAQSNGLDIDYESVPRKFKNDQSYKKMKNMLPIKTQCGIVRQYVEMEDDNEDETEEPIESNEPSAEHSFESYSPEELIAKRAEKLTTIKQTAAALASSIIESENGNMQGLKALKAMLDDDDPLVYVAQQKLVMLVLLEVFKDIIPGYRIRTLDDQKQDIKLKKETKALVESEEALLRYYKGYLQKLESATKALSNNAKKKNKRSIPNFISIEEAEELGEVAIKCLSQLLITHPHFNFRNNILVTLVPYTVSKNENVADTCCAALKMLYRQDKLGEATLEAVKQTAAVVKAKSLNVPPKVLDTFLFLKLKDIQINPDEIKKPLSGKEKHSAMSRKEIKRRKKMAKLENELAETAASESKQKKIKHQTEIINQVFLTYFRILKRAPGSVLLTAVLEGLAKFSHLINVEFFEDLISTLHNLIETGNLDYRQTMHCVQTVFTILSGQGEALNIDPLRFYTHMYKHLFDLHIGSTNVDIPIALSCLDKMIIRRRKKVSFPRLLAFMKRICTVSLQVEHGAAIAFLLLARTILHDNSKTDILLDTDNSQGSGIFLPELDEPEYCNAGSTSLWELHTLKKHYHPVVRTFAGHLAHGSPLLGEGQLPQELSRKSPEDLLDEYGGEESEFNPPMAEGKSAMSTSKKKKTKIRSHWNPLSSSFLKELESIMEKQKLTKW